MFRLASVDYRKPKHSVALAKWLIEHAPEELTEIVADVVMFSA